MSNPQRTVIALLSDLRAKINELPRKERMPLIRELNRVEDSLAMRFDKWGRDLEAAQRSANSHKNYAATLEAQIALIVESNPLSTLPS